MGDWDDFFAEDEEQAAPERQRRYRQPEWSGPPAGTAGTAVALNFVLARNEVAAILLPAVEVFRAGLLLRLAVLSAESLDELDPMMFGARHGRDDGGRLRVGVQFADGRRVASERTPSPEENEPRLSMRSGGGGAGRMAQELWLWPLPPPGLLTFVAAWPAAGLAPTGTSLESKRILAAAAEALVIFEEPSEPPPSTGDGWTAYGP